MNKTFWYCEDLQDKIFESREELEAQLKKELFHTAWNGSSVYAAEFQLDKCWFNSLGICIIVDGGFVNSALYTGNGAGALTAIPDEDWKYCDQTYLNDLCITFDQYGTHLHEHLENDGWTMFGEGNLFFLPEEEALNRIKQLFGTKYIQRMPDCVRVPDHLLLH